MNQRMAISAGSLLALLLTSFSCLAQGSLAQSQSPPSDIVKMRIMSYHSTTAVAYPDKHLGLRAASIERYVINGAIAHG